MATALKKIQDLTDHGEKFRQMCLHYAHLLAAEGKIVKPFHSSELPVFSALNAEQKQTAIDFIGSALVVFEETQAEGFRLSDSPRLLWRALRKLKWTPQSDVFDKIHETDVVTVYSAQQIQTFQNLNFFDWVSVTLEDLYAAPWHHYSRREAKCAELIYKHAIELFSGGRPSTFSPGIPEHYIEEVGTEGLTKFYIDVHTFSPLKQDGQIVGALVLNRCRAWDGVPCTVPLL